MSSSCPRLAASAPGGPLRVRGDRQDTETPLALAMHLSNTSNQRRSLSSESPDADIERLYIL